MKATLEFDIDEEEYLFDTALYGHKWKKIAQELDSYLRDELKHHSDEYTKEGIEALAQVRTKVFALIDENNLQLWD